MPSASELRIGRKTAVVVFQPNNRVEILVDCDALPRAFIKISMSSSQYTAYIERQTLLQDIVPELSPEVRETLITGMTPAEWRVAFDLPKHTQAELLALGYNLSDIDTPSLATASPTPVHRALAHPGCVVMIDSGYAVGSTRDGKLFTQAIGRRARATVKARLAAYARAEASYQNPQPPRAVGRSLRRGEIRYG